MKEKVQLVLIHGGTTFKSKEGFHDFLKNVKISFEKKEKWNGEYIEKKLKRKCEVIKPKMPLKENAHYDDWKIYFDNILETLGDNLILIGNSLGGVFLAKYLSENKISKNIISLYLIAPPYKNETINEDLTNGFDLPKNLKRLDEYKPNLFFSKDDYVVPIENSKMYENSLPNSKLFIYEDVGHFQILKFPELISMIKKDIKSFKKFR